VTSSGAASHLTKISWLVRAGLPAAMLRMCVNRRVRRATIPVKLSGQTEPTDGAHPRLDGQTCRLGGRADEHRSPTRLLCSWAALQSSCCGIDRSMTVPVARHRVATIPVGERLERGAGGVEVHACGWPATQTARCGALPRSRNAVLAQQTETPPCALLPQQWYQFKFEKSRLRVVMEVRFCRPARGSPGDPSLGPGCRGTRYHGRG
jgi:hypothetical protein